MTRRPASRFAAAALAAGFVLPAALRASPSPGPAGKAPAKAARPAAAGAKVIIPVEGLTCASCNLAVRRALTRIDGVEKVEAGPRESEAAVSYDAARVKPERLVEAIEKLGFKAGTPAQAGQ